MFPRRSSNDSGVHGRNTFTAEEFIWDYSHKSMEAFTMPIRPMQPPDTHFSDTQDPGCCPAWWTVSPVTICHLSACQSLQSATPAVYGVAHPGNTSSSRPWLQASVQHGAMMSLVNISYHSV